MTASATRARAPVAYTCDVLVAALSHPDSDRRPRVLTWSARRWRRRVRGLPVHP